MNFFKSKLLFVLIGTMSYFQQSKNVAVVNKQNSEPKSAATVPSDTHVNNCSNSRNIGIRNQDLRVMMRISQQWKREADNPKVTAPTKNQSMVIR